MGHTRRLAKLESDGRRCGRYVRAFAKLKKTPTLQQAFAHMIELCDGEVVAEQGEVILVDEESDDDAEINPELVQECVPTVSPTEARAKAKAKAKATGKGVQATTTST